MIRIALDNAGRRYGRRWIFRNLSATFDAQAPTAITGNNGSGKSTLIKMLSGFLMPAEGNISWIVSGKEVSPETLYKQVSLAAPYLELPETLSMSEMLPLLFKLSPRRPDITLQSFVEMSGLAAAYDKPVSGFSSGMKQRLKLALAFTADTAVLLLDEPLSHLDANGTEWYRACLPEYSKNRLLAVASNENKDEVFLCQRQVKMG
jgi:ABC-type multidrug transport system ATPase subunit